MKVKVKREDLLVPLQLISNVVERRQTLPVLANLKVAVDEGRLSMVGTDLEVELQTQTDVGMDSSGEATLPAKKLNDIWRSLPGSKDIVLEHVGDKVSIKCGGGRYSLSTINVAEFPETLGVADGQAISVDGVAFKRSVEQVSFAMAQQDVRYFLNGMLLEIESSSMKLVATDGHRLAMTEMELASVGEESTINSKAIIPRKGVLELLKIIEDKETFQLRLSDKLMTVEAGEYTFSTKLVEGQFPDYNKVVPKGGSIELVVDRLSFREALQRASILSNEKYRGVRLSLSSGTIKIQANNPEQEEAEEVLESDYDGAELEIGFNVGYILDVLSVLDSSEVKLTLSDGNSSVLMEGVDETNAIYVVMPMRL
mgnify:FL=1